MSDERAAWEVKALKLDLEGLERGWIDRGIYFARIKVLLGDGGYQPGATQLAERLAPAPPSATGLTSVGAPGQQKRAKA